MILFKGLACKPPLLEILNPSNTVNIELLDTAAVTKSTRSYSVSDRVAVGNKEAVILSVLFP